MASPKLQLPETSILVDSREQLPWEFITPTTIGALPYGDYSVAGLEHLIAIERKSFSDLLGSLTSGRERFETELKRARSLHRFFVIVECYPDDLLVESFGSVSRAHPRSIWGTICVWSTRYHPFLFGGTREQSARYAEGILLGYAAELTKGVKSMESANRRAER